MTAILTNRESDSPVEKATRSRGGVLFMASVGLLLAVSYLPVFSLYARQHWSTANLQGAYAHAPLTLLVIAWLVWRERHVILSGATANTNPGASAIGLLGAGILMKIYGDVQGYVVLQGLSIVPVLLGLLQLNFSASAVRSLRFPVLMLLYVVPLPNAAIDAVSQPLIGFTADVVAWVLPLLNVEVDRAGQVLTVSAFGADALHQVVLAPECSGIRSLVSLMALSSLFAFMKGRGTVHSALLLLLTLPLVLLGNCLRVTSTVLVIVFISPETAENYFHWASGLVLFAVTLSGLVAADALIERSRAARKVKT